jgi:hypothetical protein
VGSNLCNLLVLAAPIVCCGAAATAVEPLKQKQM